MNRFLSSMLMSVDGNGPFVRASRLDDGSVSLHVMGDDDDYVSFNGAPGDLDALLSQCAVAVHEAAHRCCGAGSFDTSHECEKRDAA